MSFIKVLEWLRPLWLTLELGADLLTDRPENHMVKHAYAYDLMDQCLTPARRSRSCPRAVRQPVKPWPRLLHTQSIEGPLHFQVP